MHKCSMTRADMDPCKVVLIKFYLIGLVSADILVPALVKPSYITLLEY